MLSDRALTCIACFIAVSHLVLIPGAALDKARRGRSGQSPSRGWEGSAKSAVVRKNAEWMREQQRRIDESRGAAVCFSRAPGARARRLTLTLHSVRHSLFLHRRRGDGTETRRTGGSANSKKKNEQHHGRSENVGCLYMPEASCEAFLLPERMREGTGTLRYSGGTCLYAPDLFLIIDVPFTSAEPTNRNRALTACSSWYPD